MGDRPAVLAIDGGNSKADLALLDARGTTLASIRRPGFSHQTVGLDEARHRLVEYAADLRERVGLATSSPLADFGSFCLAGVDLPSDEAVLASLLDELRLTPRRLLRNDVFAVLRAGTDGAGIAVVCGAGMNGVGATTDGRSVRYPALGEVSGDLAPGGGWLGARGLAMAIRGVDGRGAPTRLSELVPAHFSLLEPLAVTAAIYDGEFSASRLLELAPIVLQAAAEGDEVAVGLVSELAAEVVATVRATATRLGIEEVPVILGGGLFRETVGVLQERVAEGLADVLPRAELRVLRHHPVVGAALLGFDALGLHGREVRDTVQLTLDEAITDGV